MKYTLVGESGGTKTDWCLIDDKAVLKRETAFSLHPTNWNKAFFLKVDAYLKSTFPEDNIDIMLYSAGCHNKKNQLKLERELNALGYHAKVKSDLMAAGKAAHGNVRGKVAILGTGSVLFDFMGDEVHSIIGGLGHEVGDEGSGYYLGKLIYEAWQKEKLTALQQKILKSKVELSVVESSIASDSEKEVLADIAIKLVNSKSGFRDFHVTNFKAFCETHNVGIGWGEISIVGSYGYYHREILEEVFDGYGVKIKSFIKRPIDVLIEQMVSVSD